MTPTIGRNSRLAATRRGVTLIEMLVTVAVLIIIMTVMVQIFQSATSALSAAQTIQDLDNQLKLLDSTIRSDLGGATARFTPPLDPANNLGYFEYIENEFADVQGEDGDDCLRFTAKAPPGQPFTGRMWVTQPAGALGFYNLNAQPITVTSEFAEIIYFLRNGNLYRRVLLVAPELQSAIVPTVGNLAYLPSNGGGGVNFPPGALGGVPVSWLGVNDLSAHPNSTGPDTKTNPNAAAYVGQTVVLNTLGMLTNRENRFASPRFSDDFVTINPSANGATYSLGADGFSDDVNGDKVPDFYPSFYPNILNTGLINAPNYYQNAGNPYSPNGPFIALFANGLEVFPYIFPGAYSYPQVVSNDQFGWIHSPSPYANVPQTAPNPPYSTGSGLPFESPPIVDANGRPVSGPLAYLQSLNHNPLDLGDNLPTPANPPMIDGNITGPQTWQTWWGFPTWRETLSVNWHDPTRQVNDNLNIFFPNAQGTFGQPNGLTPRPTSAQFVPVASDNQLLPWMGVPLTAAQGGVFPNGVDFSIVRRTPQLFSDAQGYSGNMSLFLQSPNGGIDPVWAVSWEDDLVMTNVRSFDVKAYDNAFGGYADLGWGDDLRLYLPYRGLPAFTNPNMVVPYFNQIPAGAVPGSFAPLIWPPVLPGGSGYDPVAQTLAHEGRMPPITNDNRFDAQFGVAANYLPGGANSGFLTANNGTYNNGNLGDDNTGVVRLRRVWDSWSYEYSIAPPRGLNNLTGFLACPPYQPPIYPSYPAPYPAPLRGIQISIRVADPTNQRVKSLTIRQDFSEKL